MKGGHGVPGLPAQGIVDADHGGQLPGDAQVQVGIGRGEGPELLVLPLRHPAALVLEHEVGAADEDLFPLHHAGDAVGHYILHLGVVLLVGQTSGPGLLHHGVGHGVGIVLLQAGGQPQHLLGVTAAEGHDLRHPGGGIGQGAGLVKNNGVRLGHGLHEPPALDGDMVLAALPHGGQHRNGNGQLQGAGEVHHQHRQGLGDIPGQQIRQRRAAQGIGYQAVRQPGGPVLGGGFQLFGFLDHADDAVIPPAAGGLFHADHALALLHHGPGVYIAAGPLGHGHGLAGHGGLVHHGLAIGHPAVQGDHAAGADDDAVPGPDGVDGGQYLGAAGLEPDLVYMQGHGPGQIGHGLLVGPFLQDLPQPQHEHHGPGGGEIAPGHGHGDGGGVQHGHGQAAMPQGRKPLPDVLHRPDDGQRRGHRRRKEQSGDDPAGHGHGELVLKLPVQGPGGVLRHQVHGLRPGEGKGGQGGDDVPPAAGEADHRIPGPVIDLHLRDAVHRPQIVFQNVRLAQGHGGAVQADPQPSGGLMENAALHGLFRLGSILDHGVGLLLGPLLVDGLGVGVDILRVFPDGGDGLHDAVLGPQHGGGGVGIDLLGVLAGQDLDTGGAQQHTGGEQTEFLHDVTSCGLMT